MSQTDKEYNRKYLFRLRIFKVLFYPLIIVIDKIGLMGFLIGPIDKITRLFGLGKSVNEFWKYKDYGRLFRNDFKTMPDSEEVLLFPSSLGVNSNFTMLNLLFAKHFLEKGIKPLFFVCRSSVPICQKENVFKTRKHNPFLCHECHNGYKQLSNDTGIPVLYFDSIIDNNLQSIIIQENNRINDISTFDQCRNFSFRGIPIGQYTLKTVTRFFLKGTIYGTNYEVEIYKKYLKSTIIITLIHEKLFSDSIKIKYSIIHNGTLVFETISRLFCENQGIPYMTYENYMGKNTIIYKKNGEIMNFEWEAELKNFRITETNRTEITNKIDQLFSELQVGKHAFGILNKENNEFNTVSGKEYVCLFTNVNFDTAVIGKHTIFSDMLDWLDSIMEYWTKNVRDIQLVIRVHPAEVVMRSATQEFMGDYLRKTIKSSNIKIIDSTEKINSYDLIRGMKYGLVYSSTIGMEIAYRNRVCVVAGKPYYRNRPFVISPASRQEYFETLEKLNNGSHNFRIDRDELFRFVYFIFYKRLKYLNGIVIYTVDSEANTSLSSSQEMLIQNESFFSDFENELVCDHPEAVIIPVSGLD